MKTNQIRRQRILSTGTLMTLGAIIFLACSQNALGQWTTGTDIYNTNSGNVGVGTAPTYKFDVLSSVNIIARFRSSAAQNNQVLFDAPAGYNANLTLQQGGVSQWYLGNRAANNRFSFMESTGLIEVFSILQNGNVSIGTASPKARLDIKQAEDSFIGGLHLRRSTTNDTWAMVTGGDNNLYMGYAPSASGADAAADFTVYPLILTTIGRVGIGTTAPTTSLDVAGQIRSSTGGFKFPDGTVQTTAASGGGGTITGVTAGAGLTGGGTTGAVTLNIGAGTGLSVAADSVSVTYGAAAGTAVEGNTSISVLPGAGMTAVGGPIVLGTGGSVTLNNTDRGSEQPIFKNIANGEGTTQFSALSNPDTLRFAGGGGTTVSFDVATKKVTIDGSTSSVAAANVTAGQFGAGNYTFPANVTVTGVIHAKYQDVAEWVPSAEQIPAGAVVVLDSTKSNHVTLSTRAYDTRVGGVISEQPGIVLGEAGANKVMVATTGRVLVQVDASHGPIHIGDLLVTSDIPGVAMKSQPINLGGRLMHMPGTLIGKALEPLEKGSGKILVLLSLQ